MGDKTQNYFQIDQFLQVMVQELMLNHHHLHQLLQYMIRHSQGNQALRVGDR